MKKRLSLFLAVVMLASVMLTACSGLAPIPNTSGSSGGDTKTPQVAEPVSLNFWVFEELHSAFYKEALKDWNAKYPEKPVELVMESYPNAEMHNKLLIAIQSGVGAPDIVDINLNYFANFLMGDIQLAELNRVVDPVREYFVESRFDIYSKNGKVYGLPTHVGATVAYYNMEILNKAGVNPDDIVTWDDYIEAGKRVVEATGTPMVAFEVSDQRPFWPMIVQRGSDYLDENGKVILDNDINIDTLKRMHEMMYVHKIAVGMPGGKSWAEEFFPFMNQGGAASIVMPMWYMSRFLAYMPDLEGKIVVRPMPVWEEGDSRSAGMGGTGTAVTMQSKNLDLAIDFLANAKLTKEANIRIWEMLNFDPPRWDVWDAPELQEPDPYFGNEKIFNVMLEMKDEILSPNMHDLSAAAQDVVKESVMFRALHEQSLTPEEALKAGAEELRSQQK
ncbi:MAG: carbohydrate ABC transporter substrate-binding protein [Clostridiaceae bacterium]|nr:carbohydrate ABC transporter substrate-binding protein [Clostridiaceae bacterium]